MSARRFILTITSPGGVVFDVKIDAGNIGSVSTSPESDLGILAHGDLSLTIDNSDGAIEDFLLNAGPSDTYEVALSRQRYNGDEWDRIFGGVLDLPYSLSFDDVARTAKVTAYSYTKQLERTPADGTAGATTVLRRSLASKTASISVDDPVLYFLAGASEAADLEVGDVVRLNDGQRTEDFTIDQILDADHARATVASSVTFSAAYAEVITPGFHDKSPSYLIDKISTEAGVALNNLNQGDPLSDFPIATPLTQALLNITGVPQSLVGGSSLTATFKSTYGTKRKTLSAVAGPPVIEAPVGTWADGATSNVSQLDWTPYMDTAPGTIQTVAGLSNPAQSDSGVGAADHTSGYVYELKGEPSPPLDLYLYRSLNGAAATKVVNIAPEGSIFTTMAVEYTYPNQRVFASLKYGAGATRRVFYWNLVAGLVTASTSASGQMRAIRYGAGQILVLVNDVTNDIELWDTGLAANTRTIHWPATDKILHWTMRTWGVGTGTSGRLWFSFLFERQSQTWVAIFNATGASNEWFLVAEYRVSSVVSSSAVGASGGSFPCRKTAYQTTLTLSDGKQLAVGYAGGQWFVLSTSYAGVIRYANFKDSSCAKAARDIAIILDSVVNFDPFKVMTIINRKALGGGDVVKDLGVPLTSIRYPISELYRSSVTVTGTDSNGGSINETQGDSGDSARRLTISSDMITTPGMALACALTTLSFVSQIREQRNVTIIDDGDPLAVFDRVSLDGREWFIYRLETDIEEQTHTMTLLELEP